MRTSGAIVCSGVIDGTSIVSANVFFALSNSSTNTPADTAFTYDDFPPLNAGNYVWQATKITDSDGKTSLTGKMCLGPTTDFLSGTEVYAISTSNSTAPAENTTNWKTTYEKTKGYYLWTATRVQYTNGSYAYLNKKCVGYWGEDGNGIQSVARTYARSKNSTSTNDTTAPSNIDTSIGTNGWASSSPSVTETYPYLWVKEVVTYTKSAATTKYYCIGARGANGVDAQDIEWVYIRTKTNVAPVISGDGGSSPYTDHNSKTYTSDDHLPKVVAGSGGSLDDIEDGNSGSSSKKYECTDDPKGVDSTWKFEWEIKREKGAADANGHRAWQAYSGTMTLHNRYVKDITSANVWYALADSGTTKPENSSFTLDAFPTTLNAGKYVWEATKVTYSDGTSEFTAKMCLGPTTDFLSGTEVYAISTSNSTAPAENTTNWKTTYEKTKGYYLWTATRVQYTNGSYAYLNKKCVGYWGEDGDKGYSIALTLIRNNLYTDANWNTYAELGHSENYVKRTGDSDFTACRVSDYFVVTGTSSDSGKNHTAIYKCTSINANSITGTCVSHTKDGENGDDAVTYQIVYSEAWAKVNSSNIISARLRGHAYKIVGSTRTAMAGATIMMGYVLNNTSSQYPNINVTTNNDGYFSEDDWFDNDEYGSSGYVQGSQVIFAAIVVNNIVKCVEYITMTFAGAKGDTGRMYYIAGKFPEKAPYTRTAKLCPVVYYSPYWWYLDADSATGSDTPSDSNSSKWKKLENYGVVLTDAIFVKNFAQFGAAIITGDWLISVHGMIGNTYYGGSVENPDEYNDRAAYTYFDPAYPWGYDPFQLPVIEEEVETDQYHSWTRLTNNFKLPAGTYTFNISCYVNSSDNMHLRLFNGDESSDALYLGGTQSDELVTLTFTKTLTSSQYWNVRATMNAAGENGYVVGIEVVPSDPRFIPNYAVDLRTGKTYQSDAHIKGAIQCIGPTSKITIEDGVIRMFGAMNFPNIVLGVNEDGCAVLNFYDKNGNFKYGLGPDEIFRTKSQAESMTLKYYDVDAGSDDCTSLLNSAVVMLYLYMFKNQITNDLVNGGLYKYLAKIASCVYGPGSYCASSADAQKYNEKIIKYGYSMSAKLKDSDVYSGGGIVVTSSRTQCGIITRLSNMLNGESVDDLDYRGYNVMQDSDFNKTKEGTTYYFRTKDTYNPVQAFYWDSSYPSSSAGGIGYENAYSDKYWLNLCTNPADDETLIDPVYYFNLQCIDSNGTNKGLKTLYINRMKLKTILQNAGKSL